MLFLAGIYYIAHRKYTPVQNDRVNEIKTQISSPEIFLNITTCIHNKSESDESKVIIVPREMFE